MRTMTNPIRVLGFDGWTMGSHHYIRLLKAFQERNIELCLVHLGSWSDDQRVQSEENIGGLRVKDISCFRNSDFEEVLRVEKPDVVLFLSTETFLHRAFQRLCKHRNIPTIHLYHGLVSVNVYDGKTEPIKINLRGQMEFVLRQAYRILAFAIPIYGRCLWLTSASISDWTRFSRDIGYRLVGKSIFIPASDAISSRCCVYTVADVQDAVVRFQMSKNDVVVVGNPDLVNFGVEDSALGALIRNDLDATNVMYIDSGLVSLGHVFGSVGEYARYISNINVRLKANGKILLFKVKPHPVDIGELLIKLLVEEGVQVVGNSQFVEKLKTCCACITEPSTLGLIPALIGLPLFLSRIGLLAHIRYGRVFTTYPRAQYLDDIDAFNELLLLEQAQCNSDLVLTWIAENSGPMPAGGMPSRVADVVVDLMRVQSPDSLIAADSAV